MKKIVGIISGILGVCIIAVNSYAQIKPLVASFSVIGAADGPTAVFLAGKIGADLTLIGFAAGIAFIILGVILCKSKH